MNTSLRILIGLIMACAGFCWLPDSPFLGCGSLLAAGVLILDGVDRICQNEKPVDNR